MIAVSGRPDGAAAVSPAVSVIIANYNGARFLDAALKTVRGQTLRNIEIIVADDASTDRSVAIAQAHLEDDPRVRLLASDRNRGPAASRNQALDLAAGDWIAIFDSDDLMHPERLARLLAVAMEEAADIVADDQIVFDDADRSPPRALLPRGVEPWINLAGYIRCNLLYGRSPALGYLKPVIRGSLLRAGGIRYDESLRIAEDYDLVARLLAGGARFRVVPELTYFYRRHTGSISHRLTRRTIVPILIAHDAFHSALDQPGPAVIAALHARRHSLEMALAFDDIVSAAKERSWKGVLDGAWRSPRAALLLHIPLLARLRGMLPQRAARSAGSASGVASVVVLSRQRLIGATNGSSAYLLSLCAQLTAAGRTVHLVSPSPACFGRWPVLAMRPEMLKVFASIKIRGGLRVGRFVLSTRPGVWALAGLTGTDRLARRFGFEAGLNVKPAPYAVAVPWTRADQLFVARHARRRGDSLVADYAFLTEGVPYALRPDAGSCVVMHDLFSSRAEQFGQSGASDSVVSIDVKAEMALLGNVDCIVAIQDNEAEVVLGHLPHRQVIVAPMAITTVAAVQPGINGTLLFVGSNTAPNVLGLRWFLQEVWPTIIAADPAATLTVAGSVCSGFPAPPPGVRFLGRVSDLRPLYTAAAVVISPLLQGSGLKIKLVEALGQGKAIVATPKTMQGVEALTGEAVVVTSVATDFAFETLRLMADPALRVARGTAALNIAQKHFSASGCYGRFRDFVLGSNSAGVATRSVVAMAPDTKLVIGTAAGAVPAEAYQP